MLCFLSKTPIRGKRVLLRVDFNAPVENGRIKDDFRIRVILPAIRRLLHRQNIVILLSHHSNERQSLAPLAPVLAMQLKQPVAFVKNPFSVRARNIIQRARPGAVFLVENLRFWPGEKNNSSAFSRALAAPGEVFVNDAFGELHRPYASIVGIPKFLPSFAGGLVAAELKMLDGFLRRPKRPLVAIFGGAKVKTKIPILRRFNRLADRVLVGGALANILLKARGFKVGRSLTDGRMAALGSIARSPKLILPADAVVERGRRGCVVPASRVGAGDAIYDIGPETRKLFIAAIRRARTIVWNGPLGLAEKKKYSQGTLAVARALAEKSRRVLVGGGDTAAFLKDKGLLKKFKYVSTGGGAMLAYLAGEKLPGLEALKKSQVPNYKSQITNKFQ